MIENFKLKHLLHFIGNSMIGMVISFMAYAQQIDKSPNDIRSYQYLELENGLKAIVVQDPQAIKSACSLEISVGSFDEPKEMPGLAHFLEHMMFLGTEKFPNTDEFQTILDHHGGVFNAYTGGDRTHYYFNVQTGAFKEVLVRFSEFFKTPLFNKELMDRERKNVDSEFQMYLNQDNWRMSDVNKETSSPAHPFSRFSVGNLQTLSQDKAVLHKSLLKFFNEYYSADRMTLVLVGPDSIAEQTAFVKTYFSQIKKVKTPPPVRQAMFEKEQLGLDIKMQAKGNSRQMVLLFAMPSFEKYYQEKPLHLLSQILGYEGEGSLYDVLKKQGWITALVSSTDEHPESQDLLQLQYYLTPEGLKHIDDITDYSFQMIEEIKRKGFPEYFFNDIKAIHDLEFTYLERQPETELASDLAHRLQTYAPETVITSNFLMKTVRYDQAIKPLKEALNYLTPANVRRFVVSPELKGNRETKWFMTSFSVTPLSQKFPTTNSLQGALALPSSNPYIPENVKIQTQDQVESGDKPSLDTSVKGVKIWHLNDKRFRYPKANVLVNMVNPISLDTPKHQMVSNLFTQLVMEKLKLKLYPAIMLGEDIKLYSHPRGMTVQLSGYSDKQNILLDTLMSSLIGYEVDKVDFELLKERQIRDLKNFDQLPPFRQAVQGINPLFVTPNWHVEELQVGLEQVSVQDIIDFKNRFLANVQLEMLVNGNYSKAEAKSLAQAVAGRMALNTEDKLIPPPLVYQLPHDKLRFKTLNTSDKNHALALYVQNKDASIDAMAKAFVLSKLLMTPMYQALRVEKQIGYALGVSLSLQQRVAGLVFYVQSPNYTPDKIYEELQTFWQGYGPTIAKLQEEELRSVQTSLFNELMDPPKTLNEQSVRFWPTIEIGRNDFDLRQKIAQAIETLKVTDLQSYYQSLILDNKAGKVAVVSKMTQVPTEWQALENWQMLKEKVNTFEF